MESKFNEWCIVEVMGRVRLVGKVTEQVVAGQGFIRVDVPKTAAAEAFTRLFGTNSIHSMTPISESVAMQMAERIYAAPVQAWDLPRLPSKEPKDPDDHGDSDLNGEEE